MDIYVVYWIDSDWHQTRHISGVFSTWELAKEFVDMLDEDDDGCMISNQRMDEEFTILLK